MYEKQIIKRETQFSRAHETPDMIKSGKQYLYFVDKKTMF